MPSNPPPLSADHLLHSATSLEEVSAWLPEAPSPLAKVDCRSTAAQMTVGDALRMLLTLVPNAPDLDVVALSAPARLDRAIAHHAALAVVRAVLARAEGAG